jgi:hypothetical protein
MSRVNGPGQLHAGTEPDVREILGRRGSSTTAALTRRHGR